MASSVTVKQSPPFFSIEKSLENIERGRWTVSRLIDLLTTTYRLLSAEIKIINSIVQYYILC